MLLTAQCIQILLDPELPQNKVCIQVPCNVSTNAVFIVDINRLENPKDISCDDMGVWVWVGSYKRWCTIDEDNEVTIVGKQLWSSPCIPHYWILKTYYKNRSSQDVKKIIIHLQGT